MKENNKWKYQGDSRYEKVYAKFQNWLRKKSKQWT